MCSVSWKEVNVNFAGERRVVPLDLWLEDKTDLLLMCASQPSLPPCLSIPNVHTEPRHVNSQLKLACQCGLCSPAPPQPVRYHLLDEKGYPVERWYHLLDEQGYPVLEQGSELAFTGYSTTPYWEVSDAGELS